MGSKVQCYNLLIPFTVFSLPTVPTLGILSASWWHFSWYCGGALFSLCMVAISRSRMGSCPFRSYTNQEMPVDVVTDETAAMGSIGRHPCFTKKWCKCIRDTLVLLPGDLGVAPDTTWKWHEHVRGLNNQALSHASFEVVWERHGSQALACESTWDKVWSGLGFRFESMLIPSG